MVIAFVIAYILQQTPNVAPVRTKATDLFTTLGVRYYGTRVFRQYITKGDEEPVTLTAPIYLPGETIPAGAVVVIGITAVGSGQIGVSDGKGNRYTEVSDLTIADAARTYVYASTLTEPLGTGDTFTVADPSAKSLAYTVMAFSGVSGIGKSRTMSGYSTIPSSASIAAERAQAVISVLGLNMKTSVLGMTYSPNVAYQTAAGTDANNNPNNSYVIMDAFVATTTGLYSISNPAFSAKTKQLPSPFPWSSIILTLR